MKMKEPAKHQDAAKGYKYTGDLKVQAIFGMWRNVRMILHIKGAVIIRDATAD